MGTPGKMPRRQMGSAMVFGAGALVGAITVFVPFASFGHPGPRAGRVERPSTHASRPATGAGARDRGQEPTENDNASTCDVQLD